MVQVAVLHSARLVDHFDVPVYYSVNLRPVQEVRLSPIYFVKSLAVLIVRYGATCILAKFALSCIF